MVRRVSVSVKVHIVLFCTDNIVLAKYESLHGHGNM